MGSPRPYKGPCGSVYGSLPKYPTHQSYTYQRKTPPRPIAYITKPNLYLDSRYQLFPDFASNTAEIPKENIWQPSPWLWESHSARTSPAPSQAIRERSSPIHPLIGARRFTRRTRTSKSKLALAGTTTAKSTNLTAPTTSSNCSQMLARCPFLSGSGGMRTVERRR